MREVDPVEQAGAAQLCNSLRKRSVAARTFEPEPVPELEAFCKVAFVRLANRQLMPIGNLATDCVRDQMCEPQTLQSEAAAIEDVEERQRQSVEIVAWYAGYRACRTGPSARGS